MSTHDHDEVQKKIDASASFYDSFLNVDYRLTDYCLQTITPYFTGSHCLEIGPANGMMTTQLVKLFRQVDVAEASETLLNKIPAHPNLRKYHTRIENFNPGYRYDTIIMSHVLEHIKEPVVALSSVKNLLLPDGRFIVSVPNAKSIHRLVAVKNGYAGF
ncbi:MAG: hypothetical protein KatS3mg032_0002 [Cyclobacteriaceae bacterium]|nr:MAG: hypothetical protein KatS3mg032_0002 [Cyclobacteriaceae bacterium]